ncbi:MAG: biopolymer transporter ExbD [Rhodocyclaceae bacterium]|nr:biopolymer transporter ExbD [Rhodocyclaceae bacterium]
MAFGSFGESSSQQPMADINTTPLVDVMLVLLVIFIITAPLFHQAVPIDLPKVDATRLEDKPQVIQLALDGAGLVYWNGELIHREALPARLEAARSRNPELHLRADRATRYERVAEVMAAAQKAGIVKIAFVTDPGNLEKH